ncbi:MAG: rRNA maturation RNase YbeY [Syntrophorhabdaceae bacterium]|nr:rRNA maturation RNase YbeY [Syntrophorhabdaceae bacterium]
MSGRRNRYGVSVRQDLRPALLSGRRLKELALAALELIPASGADLRIRVAGDAAIARLNLEFFGKDSPTNVISFPDDDSQPEAVGIVSGDIMVSAPTCLSQTQAWNCSSEERVFFFILHGMLHLAGYDHVHGGTLARRMRRKELSLFRRIVPGAGMGGKA